MHGALFLASLIDLDALCRMLKKGACNILTLPLTCRSPLFGSKQLARR